MKPLVPITRDVVLVGGGHSHVEVLRRFAMRPVPGVRLTLIGRDMLTPYSGMLPGLLAGHYSLAQSHIDLQRLARFAGARFYRQEVTGLDLEHNRVHCGARPPVPFDLLSIDIGSTPRVDHIPGAECFAIPIKPVEAFLESFKSIQAGALDGRRGEAFRFLVIGAGAGGVELALSVHHRLSAHAPVSSGANTGEAARIEFVVITEDHDLLAGHAPAVQQRLRNALRRDHIELVTDAKVTEVEDGRARLQDGADRHFDAAIVVTQAAAPAWLAGTGLDLDSAGFIRVRETLQATGHADVFATGDIAAFTPGALPKSGVYAVRQGPVLADNIRRRLQGRAPRAYQPQSRTLALISTGKRHAVASYGGLAWEGAWVWRWKDWIDRRWMRKYQELPAMEPAAQSTPTLGPEAHEAPQASAMRCGGCGSKVASRVLKRALERIETIARDDVLIGLESPDDAAVLSIPPGCVLVQSVDHFRPFIDDPYLFGRITAVHCLSDLYAMGARPQSAQALVTLRFGPEGKLEDELFALLSGATAALTEAGAALVGGHTSEGPEASFGLSVNGIAERGALLSKGGLQVGDALLLTKPLGTGVVFAADMRAEAPAVAVDAALRMMLQSNRAAVEVLQSHHAHACTDITGFGLLGHLVEMLNASGLHARLDVQSLPRLPAATDLLARGFASSLAPANEAFASALGTQATNGWAHGLLFDPQTSGGLLASVLPSNAPACVEALSRAGFHDTAIIGTVVPNPGNPDEPLVEIS